MFFFFGSDSSPNVDFFGDLFSSKSQSFARFLFRVECILSFGGSLVDFSDSLLFHIPECKPLAFDIYYV